jgi:hypothetical protein
MQEPILRSLIEIFNYYSNRSDSLSVGSLSMLQIKIAVRGLAFRKMALFRPEKMRWNTVAFWRRLRRTVLLKRGNPSEEFLIRCK